jgi:hypothetical protein
VCGEGVDGLRPPCIRTRCCGRWSLLNVPFLALNVPFLALCEPFLALCVCYVCARGRQVALRERTRMRKHYGVREAIQKVRFAFRCPRPSVVAFTSALVCMLLWGRRMGRVLCWRGGGVCTGCICVCLCFCLGCASRLCVSCFAFLFGLCEVLCVSCACSFVRHCSWHSTGTFSRATSHQTKRWSPKRTSCRSSWCATACCCPKTKSARETACAQSRCGVFREQV